MQGKQQVIVHLNQILNNEFMALDQYLIHSKLLKSWGLDRLASKVEEEANGEKKHAAMIIDRIFFLDGKVEIAALTSNVGSTLAEIFAMDLELEMRNHSDLSKAIADCEQNHDFGTREMLKEIFIETEEHIDWLETQIELIERIGLEIYQQAQMFA